MNRTIQFIVGLVAALLAIGAGFYGRSLYLKEVSTCQIPVPLSDIPPYTLLQPDMFQMKELPRAMQSLPYFQALEELEGRISTVSLPAGLPVAQTSAESVENFRLAAAEYEVLSIPVEPVSAVGGQIRIGEKVNLYQVISKKSAENNSEGLNNQSSDYEVQMIAENVLVVDVRNAQGASAGPGQSSQENISISNLSQTEQVQVLTLAVRPELVSSILNAVTICQKQGGLLWTSLALP